MFIAHLEPRTPVSSSLHKDNNIRRPLPDCLLSALFLCKRAILQARLRPSTCTDAFVECRMLRVLAPVTTRMHDLHSNLHQGDAHIIPGGTRLMQDAQAASPSPDLGVHSRRSAITPSSQPTQQYRSHRHAWISIVQVGCVQIARLLRLFEVHLVCCRTVRFRKCFSRWNSLHKLESCQQRCWQDVFTIR